MIRIDEGLDEEMPALVQLWSASWQKLVPEIDFKAREAWFFAYLPGLVREGARLRVARTPEGALRGFATIDPASGYLDTLVVAADAWSAGIGALLLADCRKISPDGIDIKVNQMNARAIGFYERQGFIRGAAGTNEISGAPLWHYAWRP